MFSYYETIFGSNLCVKVKEYSWIFEGLSSKAGSVSIQRTKVVQQLTHLLEINSTSLYSLAASE